MTENIFFIIMLLYGLFFKIINLLIPVKIVTIILMVIASVIMYKNRQYLKMIRFDFYKDKRLLRILIMSLFYGAIIIAVSFVYQGILSINPSVKEFFHSENSFIKSITTFNIENLGLFDFEGRNNFLNILLSWLFFPMIVIYEEVLFRGLFFEFLNKKFKISTVYSVIIVSALFSFMHMSDSIYGLTHFFITGILFCIVYLKEKNLLYSILTHLMINIFVLLLHIIGPTNITF